MSHQRWFSAAWAIGGIVLAGLAGIYPSLLLVLGIGAAFSFLIGGALWIRGNAAAAPSARQVATSAEEPISSVTQPDHKAVALPIAKRLDEPPDSRDQTGRAPSPPIHSEILNDLGKHTLSEGLVIPPTGQPVSVPALPGDGLSQPTVAVPTTFGVDQPPADWAGAYWNGKLILPCPWDNYRTVDGTHLQAHYDTHTDPPTEAKANEVSATPWPWAKVSLHYLGDGSAYFSGVAADPRVTLYATRERADELIGSGLYGTGPVASQEHAFSGAIGRNIVCKCGVEAATMSAFQGHLSESAQ